MSALLAHAPSVADLVPKPSLIGLTRAAMGEALRAAEVPERELRMRLAQLWQWIYGQGVTDFDAMLNIGKPLRARLAARFSLARPLDGGGAPIAGGRGAEVECVYIPETDRGTLCVSSQVGCTLTCSFCHTGTQKLVRNLTAPEIVAQLIVARDRLGDFPGLAPPTDGLVPPTGLRAVTNIVFMGMGEPLYNAEAVRDAVATISDGDGLALSRRRITVSTAGVVPAIEPLGRETGAMLAISLHAVRDTLRDELVPLNRKYPIVDLLAACRAYPGLSNARRITFEYVMLKGISDSAGDARELVRLLKGLPAKINLIPFNPWPGSRYQCSDWPVIEAFSDVVFRAGYASPVRTPRGRDILAACGQLKSETEKLRARARLIAEEGPGIQPG